MTFVLQAVTVPTGSMQNTILVGDYLLVNKFIFAPGGKTLPLFPQREIRRGDIIVFKYPGNKARPRMDSDRNPPIVAYKINYVKRVVALPGETVEFRDNNLYINGQLLPEHRITADSPRDSSGRGDSEAPLQIKSQEERTAEMKYDVYYSTESMKMASGQGPKVTREYEFAVPGKPMTVPANSYFVMGDSRDQSEDGRYWGFVPDDLVIGRAMFVYWSCDRSGGDQSIASCITHPRLSRIGTLIR
jgi:signal peptidase I